uniref:Phospholysine phosphohistidine inorganic pyrophosphate phosphatase n=1 Tax=Callithrix jacchus TaxID=9483 RepID=A0A5F4W125_CALJA
ATAPGLFLSLIGTGSHYVDQVGLELQGSSRPSSSASRSPGIAGASHRPWLQVPSCCLNLLLIFLSYLFSAFLALCPLISWEENFRKGHPGPAPVPGLRPAFPPRPSSPAGLHFPGAPARPRYPRRLGRGADEHCRAPWPRGASSWLACAECCSTSRACCTTAARAAARPSPARWRRWPGVRSEFDQIDTSNPNCVVIADAGESFSYQNMNSAFQVLMELENPVLISLGKGRYYKETSGLMLDVGPYMKALEYACGIKAEVVGKPSPEFFKSALQAIGVEAHQAVMIGDDIVGDVGGAQRCGMRALQVRTGKFRPSDEHHPEVKADGYVDNLAEAVDLLLQHVDK